MTHGYDAAPVDADEAALLELATLARSLVDAVVRTRVPADRLREAGALLRRAADLLGEEHRETDGFDSRRYNAVSGLANPVAIPVTPTVDDGGLRAEVTFPQAYEGPPGYVHGGMLAMVLDQMLGHANAVAAVPGMTARFTVTYRRPTPLCTPTTVEARNISADGRKITSGGRITVDGKTTVEAEGLFIVPTADQRWQRFHGAQSEADGIGPEH